MIRNILLIMLAASLVVVAQDGSGFKRSLLEWKGPCQATITLRDGRAYTGRVLRVGDEAVNLKVAGGSQEVRYSEIAMLIQVRISHMPKALRRIRDGMYMAAYTVVFVPTWFIYCDLLHRPCEAP